MLCTVTGGRRKGVGEGRLRVSERSGVGDDVWGHGEVKCGDARDSMIPPLLEGVLMFPHGLLFYLFPSKQHTGASTHFDNRSVPYVIIHSKRL